MDGTALNFVAENLISELLHDILEQIDQIEEQCQHRHSEHPPYISDARRLPQLALTQKTSLVEGKFALRDHSLRQDKTASSPDTRIRQRLCDFENDKKKEDSTTRNDTGRNSRSENMEQSADGSACAKQNDDPIESCSDDLNNGPLEYMDVVTGSRDTGARENVPGLNESDDGLRNDETHQSSNVETDNSDTENRENTNSRLTDSDEGLGNNEANMLLLERIVVAEHLKNVAQDIEEGFVRENNCENMDVTNQELEESDIDVFHSNCSKHDVELNDAMPEISNLEDDDHHKSSKRRKHTIYSENHRSDWIVENEPSDDIGRRHIMDIFTAISNQPENLDERRAYVDELITVWDLLGAERLKLEVLRMRRYNCDLLIKARNRRVYREKYPTIFHEIGKLVECSCVHIQQIVTSFVETAVL